MAGSRLRKRHPEVDEALRRPPSRYRQVFEGMLSGFALHEIVLDETGAPVDYRFLDVNPAFERITGIARAAVVGRTVREVLPGTDLEWIQTYGRVALVGEAVRFERYHPDLDQHFAVAAFRTAPGQFAVSFTDVTDRKRAEERLRHQTAVLEQILAHIPHRVFWKDRDSVYRGCNDRFARDAGVASPAEIVGKTDFDLAWRADEARFFRQCDRQVMDTATPLLDLEEPQFQADGRQAVLLTSKVPLRDAAGEVTGVLGIYADITERKRREEERTRLAEAVAQAGDGVAFVDPDGVVRDANPAFGEMWGGLEGDGVGRGVDELFGDGRPGGLPAEVRHALQGAAVRRGRFAVRGADGAVREVEMTAAPVRADPGGVSGCVLVLRDLSHRLALEAQLRQAQRLESVGRLAGGVAHDFNNLLTVILGQGELLLMDLPPDAPSRSGLEAIVSAGTRGRDLIQQLLAFSRQQVLRPRVLDLNEVVAGTEEILRRVIGEDVELVLHLHPKLGRAEADPGQMEQVIVNLAVNARDAMPRGGTLTIETGNAYLDEAYAGEHPEVDPGPHVLLAVSDTGCGMAAEVLARIFEPFFTTKERGKGTGLGLATVYGIVRQSRGHVWAYSEPGRGSTFKVYLPRTEAPKSEAEAVIGAARPETGTETVLLVEDDPASRATVRQLLAGLGYAVLEAESPAAALRRSREHGGPIHLLLTDVVMPGMGGRELAECLAAERPRLRVLYVSGYTDDAIAHHGMLAPGVAFLQKPLSRHALSRRVREVLDG